MFIYRLSTPLTAFDDLVPTHGEIASTSRLGRRVGPRPSGPGSAPERWMSDTYVAGSTATCPAGGATRKDFGICVSSELMRSNVRNGAWGTGSGRK